MQTMVRSNGGGTGNDSTLSHLEQTIYFASQREGVHLLDADFATDRVVISRRSSGIQYGFRVTWGASLYLLFGSPGSGRGPPKDPGSGVPFRAGAFVFVGLHRFKVGHEHLIADPPIPPPFHSADPALPSQVAHMLDVVA
jgi:hypothetical protein